MRKKDRHVLTADTQECQYECTLCSKSFSQSCDLESHYFSCQRTSISKGELQDTEIPETVSKTSLKRRTFPCELCPVRFTRDIFLTRHYRQVHPEHLSKSHECPICGATFLRLTAHMNKIHTGEKIYSRDVCGKRFRLRPHLTIHVQRHNASTKIHKCVTCGSSFFLRQELTLHMKKHTGGNKCKLCDRSFQSSGGLWAHMRGHPAETKNVNSGREYSQKPQKLLNKIAVQNSLSPLVCKVCDKTFSCAKSLLAHYNEVHAEKTHKSKANQRRHRCVTCPRTFTRKLNLERHQLTHAANDTFDCEDCSFTTSKKRSLTLHKRKHSGANLFVCKFKNCRKRCDNSYQLRLHLKKHAKDVHVCRFCSYSSLNFDSFKSHEATHLGGKTGHGQKRTHANPTAVETPAFKSGSAEVFAGGLGETKSCSFCSEEFDRSDMLWAHLVSHHCKVENPVGEEQPVNNSHTNLCADSLRAHVVSNHIKEETSVGKEDFSVDVNLNKPDLEPGTTQDTQMLQRDQTSYTCQFCSSTFWSSAGLIAHKRRFPKCSESTQEMAPANGYIEWNPKRYRCEFCQASFARERPLRHHMVLHTGKSPYKCIVCGHCVGRNDQLKSHMRTHTGEKPYSCKCCKKRFTQTYHLARHHVRIHGVKASQCSLCCCTRLKRENGNTAAMESKRIIRYSCKICRFSFVSSERLAVHMRAHKEVPETGNSSTPGVTVTRELHSCDLCTAVFSNKYFLSKHNATAHHNKAHTTRKSKRSYTPSMCAALEDQMGNNPEMKLIDCHFCKEQFQIDRLESHFREHHGDSFKCRLCSFASHRRDYLLKHEKNNCMTDSCLEKQSLPVTFTFFHGDSRLVTKIPGVGEDYAQKYPCKECQCIWDSNEELCVHYSLCHNLPNVLLKKCLP